MQLQPLKNYLLCSVHEGKNLGGLVLPEGVDMQPFAKVLALGPECKSTTVGNLVLFDPSNVVFAETIDDERIVIVPEGCLFAQYLDNIIPNN